MMGGMLYIRASLSVLTSGQFLSLNYFMFDFGDCVCVRVFFVSK